ncbi:hypothetical protein BD413DRAFT_610134 [Trametes elegans]|nr:hypothetical protein BD413DRAFT_610134 [Trametes elegans]
MKDTETHCTERRWSELVPPHTALTFAAIWDPDEGMVTFSGAHLLDASNEKARNDSPYDIPDPDNQSQVLTIDRFTMLPSAGFDSLAYARDALVDAETAMDSRSCLGFTGTTGGLRVPPGIHTVPDSPAAASSMALASLVNAPFRKGVVKELVERGKQVYQMRSRRPQDVPQIRVEDEISPYDLKYAECARARALARARRPATADSDKTVTDEGFYEDRRITHGTLGTPPVLVDVNLSSAFSVTTTSTSRYVEIDHPRTESPACQSRPSCDSEQSRAGSSWTTLRDVQRDICFNVPLEIGRRLRKPRSTPTPDPPPTPTPTPAPRAPSRQGYARSSPSTRVQSGAHSRMPSHGSVSLPLSPRPSGPRRVQSYAHLPPPPPPPPPSTPADPAEVLSRRYYNHTRAPPPPPPSSSSRALSSLGRTAGSSAAAAVTDGSGSASESGAGHRASLRKTKELLQRVVTCRNKDEDEDRQWVCVEVTHKVKQRVCVVS